MKKIYETIPVVEISMDELREKENSEDESTFFEYKLGVYCEMNTEEIGIRTDISRLFKNGVIPPSGKRAFLKKLSGDILNAAERKAFQRVSERIRTYFLN